MKSSRLTSIALIGLWGLTQGCATLDYVRHYEPEQAVGTTPLEVASWYSSIGYHPPVPKRLRYSDAQLEIECTNISYEVISIGPVLPPFIPLTVLPVLIGFLSRPSYKPPEIVIELHMPEDTARIEIDPGAARLSAGRGAVLTPSKIAYGYGGNIRDSSPEARIVIEDPTPFGILFFHFPADPRRTSSFEFSLSSLTLNGKSVELPAVKFERKGGPRFYLLLD